MGDDTPEEHLIETVRQGPTPGRHDLALVAIPIVYAAAAAVAPATPLNVALLAGSASAVAYGVVVAMLFLYPP